MQHQKCSLNLYIDFLTASQKQFSGVELSKVSPEPMAHDSVSRWLAKRRGFSSSYTLFDSWYTSINNLKAVDSFGWKWIGEIKLNRLVNIKQGFYVHVSDLDWTAKPVHKVWLKAYGFVLVSKTVSPKGDVAYIAANDLSLTNPETLKNHYARHWTIETFHRGIKQCCGIERCYAVKERSQRNHILCAFLVFLKLEWERIQNAISWYEQKMIIHRRAIAAYIG